MLCCMIGYVGFSTYAKMTMTDGEKFMQANVEALTNSESGISTTVHCKCHTDGNCYSGNYISIRPPCGDATITSLNGSIANCRSNDYKCH